MQYLEGEELLIELMAQMLGYLHSSYEELYCVRENKFAELCVDQNGEYIYDVLISPDEFMKQLRMQFPEDKICLNSFGHMMKVYVAAYNNCLGKRKQGDTQYWLFFHMHKSDYDVVNTYEYFNKNEFNRVENLIIIREPVQQCYSWIRRTAIKRKMNIVLTKDEDFIHTIKSEMGLTLERRSGIDNVRVIRFEDLKYETKRTMESLCRWLGIPYVNSLLSTTLNGIEIYFPIYTETGMKYITGNDTTTVANKDFSEVLTLWDEVRLNMIYAKFKRAYGYENDVPEFTEYSTDFLDEILKKDFKFATIVQRVLEENAPAEDIYDVNEFVKNLYREYMANYNVNTEYYDYIKPESDRG